MGDLYGQCRNNELGMSSRAPTHDKFTPLAMRESAMTDTPVPHEFTSPACLVRSAEITGITGVTGITGSTGIAGVTGAVGTAAAAPSSPEDDDLVIEDLSGAVWPLAAPGICICTVGAE